MQPHLRRLQGPAPSGQAKESAKLPLPLKVPPPWMIPEIEKDKKRRKPAEDQPRVDLPLDTDIFPPDRLPRQEPVPEDENRGIEIIGLKGKDAR